MASSCFIGHPTLMRRRTLKRKNGSRATSRPREWSFGCRLRVITRTHQSRIDQAEVDKLLAVYIIAALKRMPSMRHLFLNSNVSGRRILGRFMVVTTAQALDMGKFVPMLSAKGTFHVSCRGAIPVSTYLRIRFIAYKAPVAPETERAGSRCCWLST